MKRLLRWFLPIVVLLICASIGLYFMRTAPEAKRTPPKSEVPVVETLEAHAVDYTVVVQSRGTVSPRTQGVLVAEVAGRILAISAHFRPGGFFSAGDILVTTDPSDYQHALTIARSELAQARLTLTEEKAKGVQARWDWDKTGLEGRPGALALRTPQLQRAQAALAAATARMAQAKRELERTRIIAPYTGRVLDKQVDIGQYVARGTPLATVYAVDHAEVRLPITDRQAAFLALPEQFRGESSVSSGPEVTLSATVGGQLHEWLGYLVRTEGTMDIKTRQIHVVAQVDDPYGRGPNNRPPLKVGQFVHASIQGRRLPQAFLVPRAAFRRAEDILVLSADHRIQRRRLEIVWRDAEHAVVLEGVQAGERIVLTPLPYAPDGMRVDDLATKSPEPDQAPSPPHPDHREH